MQRHARWYLDRIALGLAVVALVGELVATVLPHLDAPFGGDLRILLEATSRHFAGQPFYPPADVAGPFELYNGAILYPPVALYVLAPFLVLPAIIWWAIPLGAIAWVVWSYRPSILGWAGIVACVALPYTVPLVLAGNPAMWIAAAFALGLRYDWPAVLVLMKPSLFPFALWGIWTRGWWIGLVVLVVLSLPLIAETLEYVAVLRNVHHRDGLLYSLTNVPLMLVPAVARLASTRART